MFGIFSGGGVIVAIIVRLRFYVHRWWWWSVIVNRVFNTILAFVVLRFFCKINVITITYLANNHCYVIICIIACNVCFLGFVIIWFYFFFKRIPQIFINHIFICFIIK